MPSVSSLQRVPPNIILGFLIDGSARQELLQKPPLTSVEGLHRVSRGCGFKGARVPCIGRELPCGPDLGSLETRSQSSPSLGGYGCFRIPRWHEQFYRLKNGSGFITWSTLLSNSKSGLLPVKKKQSLTGSSYNYH